MLELAGRDAADLGIEHNVEIAPQIGAATLRVTVPAPPGRAGRAPALTLTYASGGGNSPFGAGWSLIGLPSIGVDTSERVPRWDGTDGHQLDGDALVPWLEEAGGRWQPRGIVDAQWSIGFYRRRTGAADVRVEKWVHRATGRVHFRTRDAAGVLTVFGARPDGSARIADPDDETRTFTWLPELQLDTSGDALWFEYAAETDDGIDRGASFERRAPARAQRYLKRLRYGNVDPLALDDDLIAGRRPPTRWCFQLVLDYGDHSDDDRPGAEPDRAWPVRADAFSSHRAGFDLRTYRRCRRVLSFHDFDELGTGSSLVGALVLTHDDDPAGATLREIGFVGHRRDGAVVSARALPPLRMTYAAAAAGEGFIAAPAETRENVPAGLGRGHTLVDLDGDGLPGILGESGGAWYYKPNLGGGRYGAQALVLERPATQPGAFQLGDSDRDGDVDLSQLAGRLAGLFAHDREEARWQPFRAIAAMAHVEALGGRVGFVDLNGDGRPDIVVARHDRVVWFASDGDGFAAPVDVPLPASVRAAPTVAEDAQLALFFADLDGDGLADLVRVENGRVEYWPSLGNGRFGDGIALELPSPLTLDPNFDPGRVRFVDLDGSGTDDLVYLGRGEVTVWFNASGNRLVRGPRLRGLPYFDSVSSVQIADFLGDGRPCLVWSSPLPGSDGLEYLPLGPADPPRLLLSVDDSTGQQDVLRYSSSATHYRRDAAAGRPWSTRLPSHRPVVDRHEVIDQIGGTHRVRRFAYHDGFFDSVEREARGFGQVDVYDAEAADGTVPGPGAAAFTAPSLERTWFHLGTTMANHHRPIDTYEGDPDLARLAPHRFDDPDLAPAEADDAVRVLAGEVIRRETWAVDEHDRPGPAPFDVVQSSYRVRRTQPAQRGARAAFAAVPVDTLTAIYEQTAGDPRVTHHVVVETDAFDQIVREVDIGYPRRAGRALDVEVQGRLEVVVADRTLVHVDEPTRFQLGTPIEEQIYELTGLAANGDGLIARDRLRTADVVAALAAPHPHHLPRPSNLAGRRMSWKQSFYWDDARAAPRPFGEVGVPALLHREEEACFAPALIAELLGPRVDDAGLEAAGYRLHDELWWRRGDITHLGPFQQPIAVEASDGGRTDLVYDRYAMHLVAHTDPVGNRTEAIIDYHALAPRQVTDPNGTIAEVACDALGVAVRAAHRGSVGTQPWGFAPLAAHATATASGITELVADPARFLGDAATAIYYDLDAWRRDATPLAVVVLTRETLPADGHGGGTLDGRIRVDIAYLDGLGIVLQERRRVEPDPSMPAATDRWRVSGNVVYDGKRRPARRYQPYHSPSPAFESDHVLRLLGPSTLTRFDARGRTTGVDSPDGSFARTIYGAWSNETSDANDTVMDSAYRALREGRAAADAETQALEHAKRHAGTPLRVFFDPRGRQVGSLAFGADNDDRRTAHDLDPAGDIVAITDPRGLAAFAFRRDMQGRVLRVESADAGVRIRLPDARDQVVLAVDGRGVEVRQAYDRLGRPTTIHVLGLGLDHVVERRDYGEDVPDAAARNLRGRLVALRDQAGLTTIDRCDPIGEVVRSTRRLRAVVAGEPDWRTPVSLDDEIFATEVERDALGRLRVARLPDGTIRATEYLAAGGVASLRVSSADGRILDTPVIDGADYDARGEPALLRLGNGVTVAYAYHPETLRLATQVARRGGRIYQDVVHTYDPAGNLVRLDDRARIIRRAAVDGRRDYVYDAHYRLIRASGRVHQALLDHDVTSTQHLSLDNGGALERYTQAYGRDASGNLGFLRHAGTTRSWSTDFAISEVSNRSLPARDLGGVAVTDVEAGFDACGNVLALDHLRRMDWSWRGTLARASVVERSGSTDDGEVYAYGSDGYRVRRVSTRVVQGGQVETVETIYLGACERVRVRRGSTILLERWTSHFGDSGDRVALLHRWVTDQLRRETDDPSRARFHYQLRTHQGSSAIELDEQGGVISYEEYFPFGGTAVLAGDRDRDIDLKTYRYCGKQRDDLTGLYDYGRRYYAPWMGRWLSTDPIGPEDDLNLYQFVLGDPVGNVDQDGLDTILREQGSVVWGGPGEWRLSRRFVELQLRDLGIPFTEIRDRRNGEFEADTPAGKFSFIPVGRYSYRIYQTLPDEPPSKDRQAPADAENGDDGAKAEAPPAPEPAPPSPVPSETASPPTRSPSKAPALVESSGGVQPTSGAPAPAGEDARPSTPTLGERIHTDSTGVLFAIDFGPNRLQPVARYDTGYTLLNYPVNAFHSVANLIRIPINLSLGVLEPPVLVTRNLVGQERFDSAVETVADVTAKGFEKLGDVSNATTGVFPQARVPGGAGAVALRYLAQLLRQSKLFGLRGTLRRVLEARSLRRNTITPSSTGAAGGGPPGGGLPAAPPPGPSPAPSAASGGTHVGPLPNAVTDVIPGTRNGEFNRWFNAISPREFEEIWQNRALREIIESRLRHPGGFHEWHMVSRAPVFKRWGVTAEQIAEMRTLTTQLDFVNPVGRHGRTGSGTAHLELLRIIDSSLTYAMFRRRLQNWANYRLPNGVADLPVGLRP